MPVGPWSIITDQPIAWRSGTVRHANLCGRISIDLPKGALLTKQRQARYGMCMPFIGAVIGFA
ncbi:MAG: hypothetical protein KF861_15210 [Planctomycetaceae bacterium]|nr:hypothetical protein [Planctomycetaceae bacterium]